MTKDEIDFVSKTIKAYRNGIQVRLSCISSNNGKRNLVAIYLRRQSIHLSSAMRNISYRHSPLTDTQRNWLAQGNTPPILYDVTNYETEGICNIQDADGTNTGVETDVDSNG